MTINTYKEPRNTTLLGPNEWNMGANTSDNIEGRLLSKSESMTTNQLVMQYIQVNELHENICHLG